MSAFEPWGIAMARALYGPRGFYTTSAPAEHFTTAAASPAFARAIARLARDVAHGLGNPPGFAVVDLGAGRGEMLGALHALLPAGTRLVGVEVPGRDPVRDLPADVEWRSELPDDVVGLVIANEWLDNVPVDVIQADDAGAARLVEVDAAGAERLGAPLAAQDDRLAWLDRWWPLAGRSGARAEVGLARDAAWALAVRSLHAGVAVAIDYGHVASERPEHGTLAGFRRGRVVRPQPDGSMDITAHVAVDACAAAVAGPGVRVALRRQRAVLHALGVDGRRPAYDSATDPGAYVRALAAAGDGALVTDAAGLGAFYWLSCAREIALPAALDQQLDAVEDPF